MKRVLTLGWKAALSLPLEDKNTHHQDELCEAQHMYKITFLQFFLAIFKFYFDSICLSTKRVSIHYLCNFKEAAQKRWDVWFHTFLNSDDKGMSFHGDEPTVAVNQVSQVLRHGQRCCCNCERLRTHIHTHTRSETRSRRPVTKNYYL